MRHAYWLLALASCYTPGSYYATHKALMWGSDVSDYGSLESRYEEAREATIPHPEPMKPVEGVGEEITVVVQREQQYVPRHILIAVSGRDISVGNAVVIAGYRAGGDPAKIYSEVLGRRYGMYDASSPEPRGIIEFRGLVHHQPIEPERIEVWFKVIAHQKTSDDQAIVSVYFDGDEVGSYRVQWVEGRAVVRGWEKEMEELGEE